MSLLPSYAQTSSSSSSSSSTTTYLQEWEVDEQTGELTGNLVSGNKAVRAWIYKALRTARKRYPLYTWNYGSDLEGFIGQSLTEEYLNTDLRLALEECLFINSDITGIEDYEATKTGDLLSISFTAVTIYGPVSILDYTVEDTTTRIQQIVNQVIASMNEGSTKFYISGGSLYFRSIDTAESVAEFSLSSGDLTVDQASAFASTVTLEIDRDLGTMEATISS